MHRTFHLAQVRRLGTFAGPIEMDALGKALDVQLRVWTRVTAVEGRGTYRPYTRLGRDCDGDAITEGLDTGVVLHIACLSNVHYCGFTPADPDVNLNAITNPTVRALYTEHRGLPGVLTDHGGGGDCFYLTVSAALPADHPHKGSSVQRLRGLAAWFMAQNHNPEPAFSLEAEAAWRDASSRGP